MYSVLVAAILGFVAPITPVQAHGAAQVDFEEDQPAVPGEVVVEFVPGTARVDVIKAAAEAGFSVLEYDEGSGLALFQVVEAAKVEEGETVSEEAVASAASSSAAVLFASPNYVYQLVPVEQNPIEPVYPAVIQSEAIDAGTGAVRAIEERIPPRDELLALAEAYAEAEAAGQDASAFSANYPTDGKFQWGWWAVNADDIFTPKPAIKPAGVAVIDTGVAPKHPDLKVTMGWDFVNEDKDAADDNGHGTHVAGIIAAVANNANPKKGEDGGIPGVAPGAPIYAYKVLDATGSGTMFDIAMGIRAAADNSAVKVLNLSLGGPHTAILFDAVSYAVGKDRLLVVAAGNNGKELDCDGTVDPGKTAQFPACYGSEADYGTVAPNIIVVGAGGNDLNGDDEYEGTERWCRATYSNYGSVVDIVAPGTDITSTTPNYPYNGNDGSYAYATYSGTSMAAPHVAAAAALYWGKLPASTGLDVWNQLLNESDDILGGGGCWPAGLTYESLNVAAVLNVSSVTGEVYNAVTGAEIFGGTATAARTITGKLTVVGTDKMCATCNYFKITNVPNSPDTLYVQHNISGFTKGAQNVSGWTGLDSTNPTGAWWVGYANIPPIVKDRLYFVTSWEDPNPEDATIPEIDTYLFLPAAQDMWVGPSTPPGFTCSATPLACQNILGELIGSAQYPNPPYARVMYDSWGGGRYMDTIAVTHTSSGPFYSGRYTLMAANINVAGSALYNINTTEVKSWNLVSHAWKDGIMGYWQYMGNTSDDREFWGISEMNKPGGPILPSVDNGFYDATTSPVYTSFTGNSFAITGGYGNAPVSGPVPPVE